MRRGKGFLALLIVSLLLSSHAVHGKESISYRKIVHGEYVYDSVWADLNDRKVKVTIQLPEGFPLQSAPFSSFLHSSHPAAAIAGTYFNPVSKVPISSIVVFGEPICMGKMGTAMCLTRDNGITFERLNPGSVKAWDNYETVLAAGPTLLRDGEIDIQPGLEKFKDRDILGSARRCAVGWRSDGFLILLASRRQVSLEELASAFKSLGCRDAMNLDGGNSVALWCKGTYYAKPGRYLTNVLALYDSPDEYGALKKASAVSFSRAGKNFRQKGKNFLAMLDFRVAVAADPLNTGYYQDLAETYEAMGWDIWASWATSRIAGIYDARGLKDKARHYYQKALALSIHNADAHKWMASYYRSSGDSEKCKVEEKRLCGCLFLRAALLEDPSGSQEASQGSLSSWTREKSGQFVESRLGMKMKTPDHWGVACSRFSFTVFQHEDSSRPLFLSVEAVRSDEFGGLQRTIEFARKKRGAPSKTLSTSKISGFLAFQELYGNLNIGGRPWALETAYIRKSGWIVLVTLGGPMEELPQIEKNYSMVINSITLKTGTSSP